MLQRLRERNEWKFFAILPRAAPLLAALWWIVLILRGVLPAVFAVAMGALVGAVHRGDDLSGPLTFVGSVLSLRKPQHTFAAERRWRVSPRWSPPLV